MQPWSQFGAVQCSRGPTLVQYLVRLSHESGTGPYIERSSDYYTRLHVTIIRTAAVHDGAAVAPAQRQYQKKIQFFNFLALCCAAAYVVHGPEP